VEETELRQRTHDVVDSRCAELYVVRDQDNRPASHERTLEAHVKLSE
jgi:hypothetical protein